MAISQVPPLSSNVPIVYPPGHPSAGCPTPAFATLMQILLDEKAITDALAQGAIQPGTVTTSGLTAAAQRILGNKEATTGAIEELTLSQVLDLIGSAAQGDLLFRGSAGWQRLAAGTSGQFLKTLGAGANPAWAAASGGSAAWALAGTGQTATGVYDFAVDGAKANVDFTGLASYGELLVICRGLTAAVSGARQLIVSVNNGTSFFNTSGDYVTLDGSGVEANTTVMGGHSNSSASARSFVTHIKNTKGAAKFSQILTVSVSQVMFVGSASDINAIRVINSAGGNITGGTVRVYAR